jgi:hypothetical protein
VRRALLVRPAAALIRPAAALIRRAAGLIRLGRLTAGRLAVGRLGARRAVVTGQRDGFLGHPDVLRGQDHRVPLSVVSETPLHGLPRWLVR